MALDFSALDSFSRRHIGPSDAEAQEMLIALGASSLTEFVNSVVPDTIKSNRPLELDAPLSESELIEKLKSIMAQNRVFRSFIGMGYSDTLTPPVILRNIMENPGWYTQYTPIRLKFHRDDWKR